MNAAYMLGRILLSLVFVVAGIQKLMDIRATADMLPYGLPQANPPADLRQRVAQRRVGDWTSGPLQSPHRNPAARESQYIHGENEPSSGSPWLGF